MNKQEIKELIDYIRSTDLDEVFIQTKDITLKVKKTPSVYSTPQVTEVSANNSPVQVPSSQPEMTKPVKESPSADTSSLVEIKSPMIGTFYKSPNPDAAPFVKEGDVISKGKAICIIEAMKLFNEIESEISGTIKKILVEDGTPVEYDQPLFLVDPS